jgi:hypothetical protein
MDINHPSWLLSNKLSNNPRKVVILHFVIHMKKYMLVEFCVGNYATFYGLVNGDVSIFKTSTTYNDKTIIWTMFQNSKIGILTKEKCNHYYNNNIESKCTPIEFIIKNIKGCKTKPFIITRIHFRIQLATIKTIHHS